MLPMFCKPEAIVKNLQTLPSYIIEAPDVLQIEVVVKNPDRPGRTISRFPRSRLLAFVESAAFDGAR